MEITRIPLLAKVRLINCVTEDGEPIVGIWEVYGRGWKNKKPVLFVRRFETELAVDPEVVEIVSKTTEERKK